MAKGWHVISTTGLQNDNFHLAGILYCLLGLHALMKQGAILERLMGQGIAGGLWLSHKKLRPSIQQHMRVWTLPTTKWVILKVDPSPFGPWALTTVPGNNTLTTSFWEIPKRQTQVSHALTPDTESNITSVCCFKLLNLEVICYTAIGYVLWPLKLHRPQNHKGSFCFFMF